MISSKISSYNVKRATNGYLVDWGYFEREPSGAEYYRDGTMIFSTWEDAINWLKNNKIETKEETAET